MFEYDDNPQQPPMQPQPQPAQPQQPQQNVPGEIELPFGPDDALELQRLTKTYAQVGKDLAAGKILPQLATQTRARIAPQLGQLTQRQKAAQASQAAQANMQAMQQAAQQQGIANVHMEQAMKMLPQLVAHIVDPVTGETESFAPMPDGKGGFKVEAIKFERAQKKAEMYYSGQGADAGSGEAQLPPMGSSPMTLGLGLAAQAPGMNAPLPAGSEAGLDQAGPVSLEQFAARESGQGATVSGGDTVAGTPQILNSLGENIDRRLVPRAEPGRGEDLNHVSVEAGKEFYKRANAMVPPLGPNASPHEQLARQGQVDAMARQQAEHHLYLKRHAATEKATREMHDYQIAASKKAEIEKYQEKLKIELEHFQQKEGMKQELGKGKGVRGEITHEDLQKMNIHYDQEVRADRAKLLKQAAEAKKAGLPTPYPSASGIPPSMQEDKHDEEVLRRLNSGLDRLDKIKGYEPNKPREAPGGKPPSSNEQDRQAEAARRQREQAEQDLAALAKPGKAQEEETPESLAKPSPIGHDRVQALLPVVRKGLEAEASTKPLFSLQRTEPRQSLRALESVLKTAARRGNGLTLGEHKEYERIHRNLAQLLKDHGGAAGLQLLE